MKTKKFNLKFNPVLKKELKQSMRTVRFPILVVLFNTVLAIIGLIGLYISNEQIKLTGIINYRDNIYLYILLMCVEFILLIFIMPAMTSGLISGERERQTLDILLASRLTPAQSICGKLSSALANLAILLFSGLPVISLTFIYGGIDISDILFTILYLLFIALFTGSAGIFCSCVLKKTTFATVLTYGIELLFIAAPIFITVLAYMILAAQSGSENVDISLFYLLLAFDPAITFLNITFRQTGTVPVMDHFFNPSNWFIPISIALQCAIIIIFILLSVRCLKCSPSKKHLIKVKESHI